MLRNVTALFVQFSEALRLEGISIPPRFPERIAVLEREFRVDAGVLRDLLALKRAPRRWSEGENTQWHERLVPALDAVLRWIENRWVA